MRFATSNLIVLSLLLGPSSRAAPERLPDESPLPILAWGGPPQDQTTVERYRELAEAGFTHNYSGFGNAEATVRALDVAQAAGVKLIPSLPELTSNPEGAVKRLKGHPALGGYYLRDEPSASDFEGLATWAKRIQAVDEKHPCYINLFPTYATPDQLGAPNYREYVGRFLKQVPVPILSFDHYPVVGQRLRPDWYENLEIISAAARAEKKPFWAFALAVAHGLYPVPTVAHLRVQAYSNLAYGAQGLQYFTYWTTKSDTWDFHEGPIGLDGKRTATYERVREVNREVQALRGVFVGSHVVAVGHTGNNLPPGTKAFAAAAPVKSLETKGQGAAVSVLAKGDRKFLVAVNRDFAQSVTLRITLDPTAKAMRVEKDGALHPVNDGAVDAEVAPGDVAILTWTQR